MTWTPSRYLEPPVPLAATLLALFGGLLLAVPAMIIAVAAQGAGLLVERWLFFAEATHVVTTYYGRQKVTGENGERQATPPQPMN